VSVALVIQHAKRMRRTILSSVAILSHKRYDYRGRAGGGGTVIELKMCVLILSANFTSRMSHFKKNLARYCHKYENVFMWSTRYYRQIFNRSRTFSTDFRKKKQISTFIKIRPVGPELFQTDRHDKANSRFSKFCERAWKHYAAVSLATLIPTYPTSWASPQPKIILHSQMRTLWNSCPPVQVIKALKR
jgi:hypothetical protein